MNERRKRLLIGFGLAAVTIASGFIAWWTFVIIAFLSAFVLQKRLEFFESVQIAAFAPATGWMLACLARDLFENGRISAKLASMLHLHFSVAVYAAVFLLVSVPSFFAAYSGASASKSFR